MQETWVWSLGQEDPLKKEMATPLQSSCLGNSMDRGTWWAIVHGVTESDTTEQLSTCFLLYRIMNMIFLCLLTIMYNCMHFIPYQAHSNYISSLILIGIWCGCFPYAYLKDGKIIQRLINVPKLIRGTWDSYHLWNFKRQTQLHYGKSKY